jgi:predicted ATPase/class 3 adenylate cyclase
MPIDTPLPAGTITFLFTDVVGNVPIWERDPGAMKAALARHHAILYAAAQDHHGLVFKILGDEFQIAFEVPELALEAALQAQRAFRDEPWSATGPLTVRMGLHTGPVEIVEGVLNTRDYAVSHTLNRVARIRSAAHGGQVLLSAATGELLHGYRPHEIKLRDMGDCYLKGMALPEHLYQVVVPDLPDAFPALMSISHPLHNLPLQLTSFIGREKEMAAIQQMLHNARLVTLTGPGGTGKTRLALQTASGLVEQYADGVWLVELAPLSDSALVPTLTARALGLRELTGPQTFSLLLEYLEHKQLLLILDNCEHVIEACIHLSEALLQACPKLTILTSSREALGIAGEVSFRVPPMSLPEADQSPLIEPLAQYEAVRLFVERAGAVLAGFTLTSTNAPAILQVCQRLDGIPLAIELAAARVKLLQVAEIAQRLDDRFRLLTGGSRAALPRHQTLRASIDWSYGLLSPAEASLLQSLSVFAGGWVLEAAEAVGCGEAIQACDVLELLGLLVDKSLIQTVSESNGLNRFRMLETIRQYAHEKLVESGQAEAARQRHLQYYLELAETFEKGIRGPDQVRIQERLEAELDNLRLALAWSLEGRGRSVWNPELGLRLASSLVSFWSIHGRQDEAIQWLEQLLAGEAEERGAKLLTPERVQVRARALQVTSYLAWHIYDQAKTARLAIQSRELYQSLGADGRLGYARACFVYDDPLSDRTEEEKILEALAILREAGDRFWAGELLVRLGFMAALRNEYEKAKVYWEEWLGSCKEIGDLDGIAGGLYCLGGVSFGQGKLEQARSMYEEALGIFAVVHNDTYQGYSHLQLAQIDAMEENNAQAAAHATQALSLGRRQVDGPIIHSGLLTLGRLALLRGKPLDAAEWFEEDLAYFRKKDHKAHMAGGLYYLGFLAWAAGDVEQACRRYMDVLNTYGGFDSVLKAWALTGLGKVALAQGEMDQARLILKQALDVSITIITPEHNFITHPMNALEAMALLAAAQRQYETAVRLLGATETWHTLYFHSRLPRERQERVACLAALRAAMSEQAFASAWAEGQAMSQEQAVEYAKRFALTE